MFNSEYAYILSMVDIFIFWKILEIKEFFSTALVDTMIYKFELGPVLTRDMQIPPPFRFDPTFMKDAQCAESNEKSIF